MYDQERKAGGPTQLCGKSIEQQHEELIHLGRTYLLNCQYQLHDHKLWMRYLS